MIQNILLCGVGGQGILLAAKVIAAAAVKSGFEVTTNEIHGMAQRGGSVASSVRFGDCRLMRRDRFPFGIDNTPDRAVIIEIRKAAAG